MSLLRSLICGGALLLVLGAVTDSSAQQLPDFSGIWVSDTSRSENLDSSGSMRVIRQTADAVEMVIFSRQTAYVQEITINPWKYRFGRFGPRRGGKDSREPQTQVRWEGHSLVALKSLANYSIVWFFTLVSPNEMVIESLGHGISPSFDFRRSSVPRGYSLTKTVYTRAPISYDCGACEFTIEAEGLKLATPDSRGMTFRLPNASVVVATCRATKCQVKNNNDVHPPLTLSRGETTRLSILAEDGQWEIAVGAQ
jgi:hypothetical protein